MNNALTDKLKLRNEKIISQVLGKVNDGYCGYVDLIAVTGSCITKDTHPLSDLDLMIIINDDRAYDISRCFILGEVGFDIYCMKWDDLSRMAQYVDPHVIKLLDVEFLHSSLSATEKYMHLRDILINNLADRTLLNERAATHMGNALMHLDKINEAEDISAAYMHLAGFIIFTEYALYSVNGEYLKGGIKNIPHEISEMALLPCGFTEIYSSLPTLGGIGDIKKKCGELAEIMCGFLKTHGVMAEIPHCKDPTGGEKEKVIPTKDNFKGTYEELVSNWRGKMYHARDIKSPYLSFMSMASAQNYFDEMSAYFSIDNVSLIDRYDGNDLDKNIISFENAMAEFLKNYEKIGLEVYYFKDTVDLDRLYEK